jgi:predicted DNA binding CopG/RHH family protein
MKPFAWSPEKNAQLIAERELCFEAVVVAIEAGELLDVLEHPSQARYPGQRILVIRINGYVHLVPYVEADDHLFLKTIIPMVKAMPEAKSTVQLDEEEQQLLEDFEREAMVTVATPSLLEGICESARATGQKDQRINIRLSSGDLQAIRTRALQAGIPYQTLISSILHQFVSGDLQERSAR